MSRNSLTGIVRVKLFFPTRENGKYNRKWNLPKVANRYLNEKFAKVLPYFEDRIAGYLNSMERERGHPLLHNKNVQGVDLQCWEAKLSYNSEDFTRTKGTNIGNISFEYELRNAMPKMSYTLYKKSKGSDILKVYKGEIGNLTARRLTKCSGYFYPSKLTKMQNDFPQWFMTIRQDRGRDRNNNPLRVKPGWVKAYPRKLIIPKPEGGWRLADRAKFSPESDYKYAIAREFREAINDTFQEHMKFSVEYTGLS